MQLTVKTGAVSVHIRDFNVDHKSGIGSEECYVHINISPHHEYLLESL